MKLHWKAGVPALVFTAVFLLLPGFRAGWPGVWAVASLCIWLPALCLGRAAQPAPQSGCLPAAVRRRPFAYSAFTAEDSLMRQLQFYLCICTGLCIGFFLKVLWVKHNKARGRKN